MKTLFLALLIALSTALAVGQVYQNPNQVPQGFYVTLKSGAAYADAQIDTSAIYGIGGASRASLQLTYLDSISVLVYIDYRASSSGSWANVWSDTTTATAAGVAEIIIRNATTELAPGVSGQIRVRHAFLTGNGVTSATYTSKLIWKP